MDKPYEVQAPGAAPKWTKFRRRFADKRSALRAAAARAKRGLDAGTVVVYDLRRPGTNVAICENMTTQPRIVDPTNPRARHGKRKVHAVCRIFQPMRKKAR